jgi:hypothetical protein
MATTTGTVTNATSASYVEYSNVASKPALISGSSQVSFNGITDKPALVSSSAQIVGYNVFATTGSNQFNGSQAITGSLTVTGQVVAQTLNVQQVTSSIVYSSGSNIFGNSLGNTQQFTGSVSVTGSLTTSIAAFGSAATTFLTSDSGTVKSRTAAQTLSDIAALPLAGGTLTGPLSLGTNTISSGRITLSTNDQSTNRLTITNSGAGGRSYSIVGGLNGANNSGFSIYDETAGSTRFDINSSGTATFSGSIVGTGGVMSLQKNGSGTVGSGPYYTLYNAATTDGILFQLNASNNIDFWGLTSNSFTASPVITFTRAGAATFSSTGTFNGNALTVNGANPAVNVASSNNTLYSYFYGTCGTASTALFTLGESYASTAPYYAGGTTLVNNSAAGVNIASSHASGLIRLYTGGSTLALTIASTGNVGIGVTPSAWFTSGGYKVLELGAGLSLDSGNDFRARIASNAFVNSGGDWEYRNTGFASNYIQTSGTHIWYIAPSGVAANAVTFTERMRINSSGFLKVSNNGVYNDSAGGYHEILTNGNNSDLLFTRHTAASPYGMEIHFSGASPNNTTNWFTYYYDATNVKAIVYSNGTFGSRTGTYGSIISDINYKQDIIDANSQWDDIKNLRVVNFRFKEDVELEGDGALRQIGFIAQEVEQVSPNLVYETTDRDSNKTWKSVKTSIIEIKAIKALQEVMAKIESLEAENDNLKSRLEVLEQS